MTNNSNLQQKKPNESDLKPKKVKKPVKFYVAYVFAILAWFSYASMSGIDMMSWTKSSQQWQAKGSQHQSGKIYSHK